MEADVLEQLTEEVRREFKIPPYFKNEGLYQYLREGEAALLNLTCGEIDFNEDLLARSLLKNYTCYAYFKMLHEFWENYNSDILRWQFSRLEERQDVSNSEL